MKFEVSKSPYGPDDEIGRLNEITPESRTQALTGIDPSRVFDLGVEYFIGMPAWDFVGDPPYQISMTHTPAGMVIDNPMGAPDEVNRYTSYSGDYLTIYTHTGTHIDALNHFGINGVIWNGYKASEHIGSRNWNVCGVDKQPPIIARGVMLDIAKLKGVEVLPPSYGIGEKDLQDACEAQNVELRKGDVVLVRTGRMRLWPDHDQYLIDEPGLNLEGARYLCEKGECILLGGDNVALEQLPSEDPDSYLPVHCYIFNVMGVTMVEVLNLEELAEAEVYEFAFFGAGLRFKGGTASMIRPFVIPYLK
jgi:kynurenine formamidase